MSNYNWSDDEMSLDDWIDIAFVVVPWVVFFGGVILLVLFA